MKKITETINRIRGLDKDLMEKAQTHLDFLTKPQGSLGRLEELAKLIVGITGNDKPTVAKKVIFTLAADHGVVAEGVSAFPQEVTPQMVYNFLAGGAGINVLARQVGARVVIADVGVKGEFDADRAKGLINKKINNGTNNFAQTAAMTRADAIASIIAGIELVEGELEGGIDLIGIGEMGIGNTTSASAITAAISGQRADVTTGRGTGIDDKGLERKIAIINKALTMHNPDSTDAIDVLSKVGGYEIGGMTGIILAAAANGVPVVIDGFIAGSAALLAYTLYPGVKDYMIAAHCSVERGHKIICNYLQMRPLLEFDMRLGEGTGAALAFSLMESAVRIYNEMATFASAGVATNL